MTRNKKKFGIDSEFYAYGFIEGKKSHVWYSVLPTRVQKITPLDRLKKMMVDKNYQLIQIYKSPYPATQPAFEYKKTTGWYDYNLKSEKASFKIWMVSTKPNSNVTRTLSSNNLISAMKEAYDLISKEFSNHSDWKFGALYGNKHKSKSVKLVNYTISYEGVTQHRYNSSLIKI